MTKLVASILCFFAEIFCAYAQLHDRVRGRVVSAVPGAQKLWKKKIFLIKGAGDYKDTVYLIRTVVFQNKLFRLYIHRFMRGDEPYAWHDHPWPATFLHLRNTYTEEVLVDHPHVDPNFQRLARSENMGYFKMEIHGRKLLQVTSISSEHIHRVSLDKEYHNDWYNAPLTLAFSGKREYTPGGEDDWGFWTQLNPLPVGQGPGIILYYYRHWKEYLQSTSPSRKLEDSH